MWLPKTCCCGCTLEKGSFIIGQFGIIMAIVSLLRPFLGLSGKMTFISAAVFCVNFNRLGASFVLITAVRKKNHKYLLIWLVAQTLLTFFNFGVETFYVYVAIILDNTFLISIMAPMMAIDILLQLYSLLIVYSYFRQLTGQSDDGEFIISEEKA